jgi:hypothetical protein
MGAGEIMPPDMIDRAFAGAGDEWLQLLPRPLSYRMLLNIGPPLMLL